MSRIQDIHLSHEAFNKVKPQIDGWAFWREAIVDDLQSIESFRDYQVLMAQPIIVRPITREAEKMINKIIDETIKSDGK